MGDVELENRRRGRNGEGSSRRPSLPSSGRDGGSGRAGTGKHRPRKSSGKASMDSAESSVDAGDHGRRKGVSEERDSFDNHRTTTSDSERRRLPPREAAVEKGGSPGRGRGTSPGNPRFHRLKKTVVARDTSAARRGGHRDQEGRLIGGGDPESSSGGPCDTGGSHSPIEDSGKKQRPIAKSSTSPKPSARAGSFSGGDTGSSDEQEEPSRSRSSGVSSPGQPYRSRRRASPSHSRSRSPSKNSPKVKKRFPSPDYVNSDDSDEQTLPKTKKSRIMVDAPVYSSLRTERSEGRDRPRIAERDVVIHSQDSIHARHGEGKGRKGREETDRRSRSVSGSPPSRRTSGTGQGRADARKAGGVAIGWEGARDREAGGEDSMISPPKKHEHAARKAKKDGLKGVMAVEESPHHKGDDDDEKGGRSVKTVNAKKTKKKKSGERFPAGEGRRSGMTAVDDDDNGRVNKREDSYVSADEMQERPVTADASGGSYSSADDVNVKDCVSPASASKRTMKKEQKKKRRDSVVEVAADVDGDEASGFGGSGSGSGDVTVKPGKGSSSALPERESESKATGPVDGPKNDDADAVLRKKKKRKRVLDTDDAINPRAHAAGSGNGSGGGGRFHAQNGGLTAGASGASLSRTNSNSNRKYLGGGSELDAGEGGADADAGRRKESFPPAAAERDVELSPEDLELMKELVKYLKDKHVK